MAQGNSEKIKLEVDVNRIIEVLAKQIYQSPLALLRENTQNAFDAVLLRQQLGHAFDPKIQILVSPNEVRIEDNGIGMTPQDLRSHFWRAGSSSKNTPEAKAAGVVGTFGIGAMANFGIAAELEIATESAVSGERTISRARREALSTTEECIDLSGVAATGQPGTVIIAKVLPGKQINVVEAERYLREFVSFSSIPILFNGQSLTGGSIEDVVPTLNPSWKLNATDRPISGRLVADVTLLISSAGEIRITLKNIKFGGNPLHGLMVFRQNQNSIRSFRNGFGLAVATVTSDYNLGGVADILELQPTAGREALETSSIQLLQSIVVDIDNFISVNIGSTAESDHNNNFMNWLVRHNRSDLANHISIRCEPSGANIPLGSLNDTPGLQWRYYAGADPKIIRSYTADDAKLLVLATSDPRRECQLRYLRGLSNASEISNAPKVITRKLPYQLSFGESALCFRIKSILDKDYFLQADVELGEISHGLPLVVEQSSGAVTIVLDPTAPTLAMVLRLYDAEYEVFGSMVKDFVRSLVFPHISAIVPSSGRLGADAFLRSIRRNKELFEIDAAEMTSLSAVWQRYLEGMISIDEAASRSAAIAQTNFQVIGPDAVARVSNVVRDVVENERRLTEAQQSATDALPAIMRLEIESDAKILTLSVDELPLKEYKCFLALSERYRDEYGDFFLQPHFTSIVWGGQKVLFVFQHHSRRFGLYYDLQLPDEVSAQPGGRAFVGCTLMLKNKIFIPVPESIQSSIIPSAGERKRLEVRCDLIYADEYAASSSIS